MFPRKTIFPDIFPQSADFSFSPLLIHHWLVAFPRRQDVRQGARREPRNQPREGRSHGGGPRDP